MRHGVKAALALIGLVFAGSLCACDSTVVDTYPADQGNIINGTAYDAAAIDLGTSEKLVVPEGTVVRETAADHRVHVFLQKRLAWTGQALLPTDIHFERTLMGCAWRRDGNTITVATFGTWDSKAEGGAFVMLAVDVPPGLKVETREGLTGAESPALAEEPMVDSLQTRPFAAGWYKVKDQPDKTLGGGRFAKQAK